jgi:hypothetical protein
MKINILQNVKLDSNVFPSVYKIQGPGISVGIATDYGLDGPGSNYLSVITEVLPPGIAHT